jgi:phytoene synthase
LLKREITRTRGFYSRAEPGIDMLSPGARGCVRAAFQLYGDILKAVEDADYQVFGPRIRVTRARRAQIAAGTVSDAAKAGIKRRLGRQPAVRV